MRKVRRRNKYGVFLKVERLANYTCEVWKDAKGSSTTYRWIDNVGDFSIVRSTIVVSNRPVTVRHRVRDGEAYVRTRGATLLFRDFVGISPIKIENWEFRHGMAGSMTDGYLIDAGSFARMGGDRIYVARTWF